MGIFPGEEDYLTSADLLLVVTAVSVVSTFFSSSMISAGAQISTNSGAEVREFHGTIVPARTAEISPRYNGLLSKIHFIPGQFVEEGNLLFEFRTNDQELAVEIDQSKLQRAEADLRMAELTLKNKQHLHAKKIMSEPETLQAEASRDIAAANVAEAPLTVQLSQSMLKNMKLYAPISGKCCPYHPAEGDGRAPDLVAR
jgi:multidrug efflux pump subunit AcrA (membrane-fusion protein)